MKSINEYLNRNIYEGLSKEELMKKIESLKTENEKLGEESDELFNSYATETEEDFWNDAPEDAIKRNDEIWDQISDNTNEINKLYKELQKIS